MEVNNAAKSKINADTNGARTVFDRFHNPGPDSYFSTNVNKPQNSFKDSGFLSYNPFSDCSVQDCAPLPYTVWPTQEDECKSRNWPQVVPNNRNLIDGYNCGSEADLYGLVSDILDEPDSMDPYSSYVSEKKSSRLSFLSRKEMKVLRKTFQDYSPYSGLQWESMS